MDIIGATDHLNTRADRLVDLAEILALAGQAESATRAREEALELYEQKGNLVSAGRTRDALGR